MKHVSTPLRVAAALALFMLAIAGPATAQNPNSCSTTGFSGYFYTATYDAMANTTTYNFTFCNRSPINGVYVNIGEIYLYDMTAPVGIPGSPPGWQFNAIGPKLFWSTTSNPWWKTPPAIAPGACLSGFTYVIPGPPDTDFVVFTHVQQVTDATGQEPEDSTWFDCSVIITPPAEEPCISIIKSANPVQVTEGKTTYTYEICNCGDITLTVTSLIDDVVGDLLSAFETANSGSDTLGVGACVEFSVEYMIQPDDVSPLQNCATVTATCGTECEVDDTACATIFFTQTQPNPCVSLDKTVVPDHAPIGGLVTYNYRVCNCGNAALTVTEIDDSNPTVDAALAAYFAGIGGSFSLDLGECRNIEIPYLITAQDQSPLFNCATVFATDPEGGLLEDDDCARVDIDGIPPPRFCFRPVTLTQELWSQLGRLGNPVVPTGVVYNRFAVAFASTKYYGKTLANRVRIGDPRRIEGHTITFDGSYSGLYRMTQFLPQIGKPGKLRKSYSNPTALGVNPMVAVTNSLAGETLALVLNIAYNDMRVMPRNSGHDIELFTLTRGPYKGKRVGEVLNIANSVLSGAPPVAYGLGFTNGYETLVEILRNINSNYALFGICDFVDRGYLKPDKPLYQVTPGHTLQVPSP